MQTDLYPKPAPWSPGRKFLFRFFFLWFPLYIFLNPNGVLPYIDDLYTWYIQPFQQLIPWIAKHILHLPYEITVFTNGSGDTTYDYVVVLFITVMALLGAVIWTLVDRYRPGYNQLYYWLTAAVRYYVSFTMLTYGFVKVFKLQFPSADPWRLLEPYGESSPMGLAWTFMGYSKGYNLFTGGAEVLGGLLLLFRRTTTLGSIVTFVVMGNVMAMNYCFDIPVKLLSTVLVFMSLFLMAKDIKRLFNFFILHKPAAAANISAPYIRKRGLRIGLRVFKFLLVGYTLVMMVYGSANALSQYGDNAKKTALYGIYNVETFVRNHDTILPLQTDTTRWKQMIVGGYRNYPRTHLKGMNDSLRSYVMRTDTVKKEIVLFTRTDTTTKHQFSYYYPDKEHMVMQGTWKGDSVIVRMKIYDLDKFLLVNRGFRWINEYPFNR